MFSGKFRAKIPPRSFRDSEIPIKVDIVQPGSAALKAVQTLWRHHSATLGFFPEGAFDDHAAQGRILAALDGVGNVAGYLAYRVSKGRAAIVHLCVAEHAKGKGVARILFTELRRISEKLFGIAVTCRTDFAAAALWPRLGFSLVKEVDAKESGKFLGKWWFDHGHPDLFSCIQAPTTYVVLDANVFFDIHDKAGNESMALTADWVQEEYTLSLTPEVTDEIRRAQAKSERDRRLQFAATFPVIKAVDQSSAVLSELNEILGPPSRPSDFSDRLQLMHTIQGKAMLFVTRDEELLNASQRLEDRFGIRVLRPSGLVSELDAADRPFLYQPSRLEGSNIHVRQPKAVDEAAIVKAFQYYQDSESKSVFERRVRNAISTPRTVKSQLIEDGNGKSLAFLVTERASETHRIVALRTMRSPFEATLATHLTWRAIVEASIERVPIVEITDRFLAPTIRAVLPDLGFINAGERWVKLNLQKICSIKEASHELQTLARLADLADAVIHPLHDILQQGAKQSRSVALIEKTLWPLKLSDAQIPCFVVPIRPYWASQLFDGSVAAETLFGARDDLMLRFENAYYRSTRPGILSAPGRILWYVSNKAGYSNAMQMRAASILNDVVVGSPKEVFPRFRRLGVYSFKDVSEVGGAVMAFSFSHTEALKNPLTHAVVQNFFREYFGNQRPLQSPQQIPSALWCDLYASSMSDKDLQ